MANTCRHIWIWSPKIEEGKAREIVYRRCSEHVAPKLFRGFRLLLSRGGSIVPRSSLAHAFDSGGIRAGELANLLCPALLVQLRHQTIHGPPRDVLRAGCLHLGGRLEELFCNLCHRRECLYLVNLHVVIEGGRVQGKRIV